MHFLRVANNIRATFSSRKSKQRVTLNNCSKSFRLLITIQVFIIVFFLSLVQSSFHSKLIDELSPEKERRLSQFGSTALIKCGKYRQGLSDYSTMERQLIQTRF